MYILLKLILWLKIYLNFIYPTSYLLSLSFGQEKGVDIL